ncbi:DUF4430 domain-containing protein [Chitinivorax sp. B]|uniref:DUF4430 domain-containing protein n=1 Tax=Chitinivorax sp. B TaxID=2502235 RepID=UPI001485BE10|nr:DUF4430 domain-containing protein [Chitinivorax sp. B]
MGTPNTVQVSILGGPSVSVPWFSGMNAQQALEGAYGQINNSSRLTYALQYYGSSLGYLVMMINETYDSFAASAAPFFYWEFLLNGAPASVGIDQAILNAGDTVGFTFVRYDPSEPKAGTVQAKHIYHTTQT